MGAVAAGAVSVGWITASVFVVSGLLAMVGLAKMVQKQMHKREV
jgi:hypothetical protein